MKVKEGEGKGERVWSGAGKERGRRERRERIGLSRNPESSFLLVVSAMEVSTQRSLF